MTTPYRRGSEPGASGNPLEDIFPDFPAPWNGEWILTAGAASTENTEEVLVGRNLTMGASGGMGASGATGSSGTPVTVLNKSSMPSLHQRDQSVVEAVFQGAVPMLGAWEGAADALNRLMGGFNSLEQFIETLFKVLTGANVDLSFITEGARVFLELLQTVFGPIGEFFTQLWETIGEEIFLAITDFLGWVWNLFSEIAADLGEDVRPILEAVTNVVKTLWETFGDVVEAILQPVSEFLKWLFTNFGTVVETFIKPIINWLFGIWGAIGAPLLSDIAAFLASLWETIGEPALLGIFGVLSTLWNTFDEVVIDNLVAFFVALTEGNLLGALEEVGDFFKGIIDSFGSIGAGLFNGLPSFADIGQIVLSVINAITGGFADAIELGIASLINLFATIPLLKPLIDAIIPPESQWRNPVTGEAASSLSDLRSYANELIRTDSVIYSQNLQGPIPPEIFPVISPGLVGDTRPNLVSDSGFRSAAAVQAGSGWSWDSTVSRTSGDGGSAKVVGDGGVKQMFSNLVAVSPGQEIECAVYARWTKPSAARPTISVGLRGYINDTVVFTQAVASQSNIVQNSASFTGNASGWVEFKGTYAIPQAQALTHVRLVLSVLNAPAGTSVWFDEASLRKVSLIGQALVSGAQPGSNLADDIENAVGNDQYQALLDRVAKKTGASLADVQATVEDFLDGNSTISGNQIQAGNIASTYINELRGTWDTIYQGVNDSSPPATGTVASALDALASWRTVIAANGGLSSGAVSTANLVDSRVTRLETEYTKLREYVGLMAVDIRAVAIKNGISPTTPPTPPGETPINFASFSDNFDRATIGSGWSVNYAVPNSGALIIPDGNNAFFDPPNLTAVQNVFTAVYAGGNSLTEYQRVFCTLGSGPGRPLVGSPGYNDLLGRVAGPTTCIVARFYNDFQRTVRLFWRTGAWELNPYLPSNQFGVFNMPSDLTSGSVLEFYVGNKAGSDQTKCFVKVGTWTSGVATMNASALSVMGRGWGFGGGNGLSGLAAQDPGKVNFWGAQDQ